jgi:cell division protein FtsQ
MDTSPWIADIKLNKIWPDILNVEIIEQVPAAQWEDKALINPEGDVFYVPSETFPKGLPILFTEEEQVPELLEMYEKMRVILSPIHANITRISASDREAITLTLDNGTQMLIGRKDPLPRLQRFVKVHPRISRPGRHAETIDLRYEHGISVKWREEQNNGSL